MGRNETLHSVKMENFLELKINNMNAKSQCLFIFLFISSHDTLIILFLCNRLHLIQGLEWRPRCCWWWAFHTPEVLLLHFWSWL